MSSPVFDSVLTLKWLKELRSFFTKGIYSTLVPEEKRWLCSKSDEDLTEEILKIARSWWKRLYAGGDFLLNEELEQPPLKAYWDVMQKEFSVDDERVDTINTLFLEEHVRIFVGRMFGINMSFQSAGRRDTVFVCDVASLILGSFEV